MYFPAFDFILVLSLFAFSDCTTLAFHIFTRKLCLSAFGIEYDYM